MPESPVQQPRDYPTREYVHDEVPSAPVSDEIWKLILDRSKIPEVMSHTLKGEVWAIQEVGGKLVGGWIKRGESLMNEKGVRFFSSFFFSAMTPDKLATFFTEEEVARMARDMTKAIIYIIAERGDEFGIEAANRTYIVELLDHFYFSNLTASRKGTILAALKPAYERKEIYSPQRERGKLRLPSFLRGRR